MPVIPNQDILRFQVSIYNINRVKVLHCKHQLTEKETSSFLTKLSFALDVQPQLPPLAEVHHHIQSIRSLYREQSGMSVTNNHAINL